MRRYEKITLRLLAIGFLVGGMLLSNCATVQQLAGIQKPDVDVESVRLTGLSFDTIDLAFDVAIHNPNALSATLAGFDYDLQINKTSFLKGEKNSPLTIQAQGKSVVEIPVTLGFKELYSTYQALKDQDSTGYKIACGLSFDLPVLGPTRIPVSTEGKIPLLKLPAIKVESLKLDKLSFSGADLTLRLGADNPNSFDFVLDRLAYELSINDKSWARGTTQKAAQVSKKGAGHIEIPISLDFAQMGQTVYQLLTGSQELNYKFGGDLDLTTSLPLLKQASLPFTSTGQVSIAP